MVSTAEIDNGAGANSDILGIKITFSGPVDPTTFTTAGVNFVTDPAGNPVAVQSVIDITPPPPAGQADPHNVYEIVFATPSTEHGFYNVSIGPYISDFSGDEMDQNQNGINGENPGDVFTGRVLFQPEGNSAPVLNNTTPTFPAVAEDQTAAEISGTSVNAFVAGMGTTGITDADSASYAPLLVPVGIAVTGVDDTNGLWQYSLNDGTTWGDFAAAGVVASFPTAAVLLAANYGGSAPNGDPSTDLMRFLPISDWNGVATFAFNAWDLTSGLIPPDNIDGGTVDLTQPGATGGTTAFSSAGGTATINVLFVNQQPSYTASNPPTVLEDSGANTVSGWAGGFNPGGPNDASQTVYQYSVSNVTNPGLFSAGPAVDANGNLTYTLNPDVNGTSNFDVQVEDDGGTQALAAAINFGGSGYSVGNILTVLGGTSFAPRSSR